MLFVKEKPPEIQPRVTGGEHWAWGGFPAWDAARAAAHTTALVDQDAVSAAMSRLVGLAQRFDWVAGTVPKEDPGFVAPPSFDTLCGAGRLAMSLAPDVCRAAGIDPAHFAARCEAREALVSLAHGAARARAEGFAATRLTEALGEDLVTRLLDWLQGECFPQGPADYGYIGGLLDDFAPFLHTTNAEVRAQANRKKSRARLRLTVAEELGDADEQLQAARIKHRLRMGQPVTEEELLRVAAAEEKARAPKPKRTRTKKAPAKGPATRQTAAKRRTTRRG